MNLNPRPATRVAVALVAAGATVSLAACSSSPATDGEASSATDISVADYYTDEPSNSIMQKMLDQCGAKAGVSITREAVPSSDYLSKVLQQASSKTLPDIQMLDHNDLPAIATTGALHPLAELDVPVDNLSSAATQIGTVDDQLYGGAPTLGTVVMFYNKSLFSAAGLEPPKTWADLKADAAALTNGDTYGIAFSAKNSGEGPYAWLPLLWSNGGSEDDLESSASQEALQFEVDLVTSGSASESVVQWGNSDVGDQFNTGKAAMAIVSATQQSKFDENDELDYGLIEVPVPNEGDTSIAPVGGEVWTLPRTGDADREAKAAEVVKCIISDDTQLSLAEERGVVPANPDLDEQYLKDFPTLSAYVDTVNNGRSRTAILGEDWPKLQTALATAIQSAITGQSTVSEALATAAASVK